MSIADKDVLTEMLEAVIQEMLDERRIVIKVNSKGQKRRKVKCGKGMKYQNGKCVPIVGREKLNKKKGIRKAVKTKRRAGAAAKKRAQRLRNKALKKRRAMGL